MEKAEINGVELAFDSVGSGEPVLFISPVLTDGFLPLFAEPALSKHYRLIRYHKRGWGGSTHPPGPTSIAEHAADARALLAHLDVSRAHVVGHSSGAAVAVQLALDAPERVATLALLELSLLSLPHGQAFLEKAGPVFALYESGKHEQAFAAFMTAVSGLEWEQCRRLLEERAPGTVARAVKDADTFFGVELPGLAAWKLDAASASKIDVPVLSVRGAETLPLWVEVAAFLRESIRDVEDREIEGVGHLLHVQRPTPVAESIRAFLDRHRLADAALAGPPNRLPRSEGRRST